MKKKVLVTVSMFLFFLIAQNGWAIQITRLSGVLYAGISTTYPGKEISESSANWDSSAQVNLNNIDVDGTGNGFGGKASADKINGESGLNSIRFILSTTAQARGGYGKGAPAFYTSSIVRSGSGSHDMIEFRLDPDEENEKVGQKVKLTGDISLTGSLSCMSYGKGAAETSFDFVFEIYRDPGEASPVVQFQYSSEGESLCIGTLGNNSLESNYDDSTFKIGDCFYVYFSQDATAAVSASDRACSANVIQAQDGLTALGIALTANAIPGYSAYSAPSPEPSTLLLLIFGFLGLLIGVPGIKKGKSLFSIY